MSADEKKKKRAMRAHADRWEQGFDKAPSLVSEPRAKFRIKTELERARDGWPLALPFSSS